MKRLLLALLACVVALGFEGAPSLAALSICRPPSTPIVVLVDALQSVPSQRFVPEVLRTIGLLGFETRGIRCVRGPSDLPSSVSVVILPPLHISARQQNLLRSFVSAGGVLLAFKPDPGLASLFGVSASQGSMDYPWIAIDATTLGGTGVDPTPLRIHDPSILYTPVTAAVVARLFSAPDVSTNYPAVAVNRFGRGYAILFSFDMPRSVAMSRQGNPAWAGKPDNNFLYGWRPDQMFLRTDAAGTILESWNNVGGGGGPHDLNDVPQVDELMGLLANLIVRYAYHRIPLPRVDVFPASANLVLVLRGDQHEEDVGLTQSIIHLVNGQGGGYTVYLWYPFVAPQRVPPATASLWHAAGNELAIHFNYDPPPWGPYPWVSYLGGPLGPEWSSVSNVIATALQAFAATYPGLPKPRTVGSHNLIWLTRNPLGARDPIAHARLYRLHGIEMDTSFSAIPRMWGYMTGSGLPMKFLDTRSGEVIDVYEQATHYQDGAQMADYPCDPGNNGKQYSMGWNGPLMKLHMLRSFEESRLRYHTGVTALFHTNTFEQVSCAFTYPDWDPTVVRQILSAVATRGGMIWTAERWLDLYKSRAAAAVRELRLVGTTLTFSVSHSSRETLLVRIPTFRRAVTAVTVDGAAIPVDLDRARGAIELKVRVHSGTHAVRVDFQSTTSTDGLVSELWARCSGATPEARVADVDGNGQLDVLCRDPVTGQLRVALADGRGGFSGDSVWLSGWCSQPGAKFGTGDFNGDGRSDVSCITGGATYVAFSNGSSAFIPTPNGTTPWLSGWCSQPGAEFGSGDFSGDGRSDIYCLTAGSTYVAFSNGASAFTPAPSGTVPWLSGWCGQTGARFGAADFNGDGRADLYCITGNSVYVALSNGTSAFTPVPNAQTPWPSGSCGQTGGQVAAGDWDGDGRADLFCKLGDRLHVAISNGINAFVPTPNAVTPVLSRWCDRQASLGAADANGDGRADPYCLWRSTETERSWILVARPAPAIP